MFGIRLFDQLLRIRKPRLDPTEPPRNQPLQQRGGDLGLISSMLCHGQFLIKVTALQTWLCLFSFSHWILVKLMVRVLPHDSPQLRYVGNAFFSFKNFFLSITLNITITLVSGIKHCGYIFI